MMFNLPRDCIRNYFPTRKCFTFPQPVPDRKMLQKLETLSTSDLDPEFLEVAGAFVNHVSSQTKCKTVAGRPVSGSGESLYINPHVQYFPSKSRPLEV